MAASKKKAAAKSGQEMAEAKNTAIVTDERPDFAQGPGRGSENVTSADMTIPRVDVVQALSPQIKRNDPDYIEGAEQGDIFNTVTGELYGGEIHFIPCYYRKEWVVWKSRQAGGGFCGAFDSQEEAEEVAEQLGTADDGKGNPMHEAVDTAQHFGLVVKDDGSVDEVVLSLSRTKMKMSRTLNTMARMAGGDSFASVYSIESVEDQNRQGQEFWNLKVKRLGWVTEDLYKRAENLYEAVKGGRKDIDRDEAEEAED